MPPVFPRQGGKALFREQLSKVFPVMMAKYSNLIESDQNGFQEVPKIASMFISGHQDREYETSWPCHKDQRNSGCKGWTS